MTPHTYTYEDPDKQRIAYRGYVKQYDPDCPQVTIHNCAKVHYNKAKALQDARALIIKLKKDLWKTKSVTGIEHLAQS